MNTEHVRIVIDVTNKNNGAKQMVLSIPLDAVLVSAFAKGEAVICAQSSDVLLEISLRPIQ